MFVVEFYAMDRPSYALHLIARGNQLLARLLARALEHDARLDALVGPSNKMVLLRPLRRIIDRLE